MSRALSLAVWESGPLWAHLRHLLLKGNCLMVWKLPSSWSAGFFCLSWKTAVSAILLSCSKFAHAKMYLMLCIGSRVPWCVGCCGLPTTFEVWFLPSALLLLQVPWSLNSNRVGLRTPSEENSRLSEFCCVLKSDICLSHWDLCDCF